MTTNILSINNPRQQIYVRSVLVALTCNPEIQGTELAQKMASLIEAGDKKQWRERHARTCIQQKR